MRMRKGRGLVICGGLRATRAGISLQAICGNVHAIGDRGAGKDESARCGRGREHKQSPFREFDGLGQPATEGPSSSGHYPMEVMGSTGGIALEAGAGGLALSSAAKDITLVACSVSAVRVWPFCEVLRLRLRTTRLQANLAPRM